MNISHEINNECDLFLLLKNKIIKFSVKTLIGTFIKRDIFFLQFYFENTCRKLGTRLVWGRAESSSLQQQQQQQERPASSPPTSIQRLPPAPLAAEEPL